MRLTFCIEPVTHKCVHCPDEMPQGPTLFAKTKLSSEKEYTMR